MAKPSKEIEDRMVQMLRNMPEVLAIIKGSDEMKAAAAGGAVMMQAILDWLDENWEKRP